MTTRGHFTISFKTNWLSIFDGVKTELHFLFAKNNFHFTGGEDRACRRWGNIGFFPPNLVNSSAAFERCF